MDRDVGANRARDVAKVAMVTQIYNLPYLSHFGEQTKRLLSAEVIEGLQNVVGHERHRAMLVDELEIAGDTQR